MLICLDAGHGGKDPGALGKRGTQEKDINLSTTFKLGDYFENLGHAVIFTRTKDIWMSLIDRVEISNKNKCDLFISIHCNSTVGGEGIETYNSPGSIKGKEYATKVQKELIKATGLRDRGVKEAKFTVIYNTNAPAILVESAFIDNPKEEIFLMSEEYRNKVAKAIAYAITGKSIVPKVIVHDEKVNIVLLTQKFLNQLEIKDHEGKKLIEDGLMGKRTEIAYKKLGERLGV